VNPTQPESFIDRVRAYLPEMPQALHQISDVNQIRVVDTPRVWGLPMTESGVSSAAREAVTGLAAEIQSMLSGAGHTIDIVSLDAPKDQFLTAITDGLKAHAERDTPLLVRLLFGFVPVEGAVEKFVKALAALRKAHLPSKNITMLVGQYYTKQEMWWNHAKIVAVDGKVAIVGGHNLWSDAYGGYPPVHDISLQVAGPAAADAHGFAEFIWTNGGYYLDAWLVTAKGTTNLKNGKERNRLAVPGLEIELDEQPRVVRQRSGGWHRGRVMALGRAGGLNKSTLNASDVAKRVIITSARKSLKICQQDLLFLGAKSIGEHQVCGWIVDALLASDQLEVQIVVSPVDGSGGGAQYSWGSGAIGTHGSLKELLEAKCVGQPKRLASALDRLAVAPFCFTGVQFLAEGRDYHWPEVPQSLHVHRFSTKAPLPDFSGGKLPPAPGNHAKFYLADDQVYYVGSDNLYPHNLAEFGYLVEGDSVKDLLENYWNQVWKYSRAHCITEETLRQHRDYDKIRRRQAQVAQRNSEISEEVDDLFQL
jgi:murine toxin